MITYQHRFLDEAFTILTHRDSPITCLDCPAAFKPVYGQGEGGDLKRRYFGSTTGQREMPVTGIILLHFEQVFEWVNHFLGQMRHMTDPTHEVVRTPYTREVEHCIGPNPPCDTQEEADRLPGRIIKVGPNQYRKIPTP